MMIRFFFIMKFFCLNKKKYFIENKYKKKYFTRLIGNINDDESLIEFRRLFVIESILSFFLDRAPKTG